MRHLLNSLLMALAIAAIGCHPPFTSPANGGPAWREIATEHFVLKTDLDEKDAEPALATLEERYRTLEDLAFPRNPRIAVRKLDVVVFRDGETFAQLAGPNVLGVWRPGVVLDAETHPVILLPRTYERRGGHLTSEDEILAAFTHELTHDFEHRAFGAIPTWFSEGLADYYSTMRVDGATVVTGELSPGRAKTWPKFYPRLGAMLQASRATFYALNAKPEERARIASAFYAEAATFVVMLNDPQGPYFERYRAFVGALQANARPEEAMKVAFGDLSHDELQRGFWAYMVRGEAHAVRRAKKPHEPVRFGAPRMLSDAEVHLLWARLALWDRGKPSYLAYHELEEAEREAPSSVDVLIARARYLELTGQYGAAQAPLERAIAAAPTSPTVLAALIDLDRQRRDAVALARDVARLEPVASSAEQLRLVSLFHLANGDRGGAITFAKRAVETDPSCATCVDALAEAYAAAHQYRTATTLEERALALLPDRVTNAVWSKHVEDWTVAAEKAAAERPAAASLEAPPSAD